MKIYYKDILVAESINEQNSPLKLIKTTSKPTPPGLFKDNIDTASYSDFYNWVRNRVFPEERVGATELISQLGLDKYDPIQIATLTKAKLFSDSYWVDWE